MTSHLVRLTSLLVLTHCSYWVLKVTEMDFFAGTYFNEHLEHLNPYVLAVLVLTLPLGAILFSIRNLLCPSRWNSLFLFMLYFLMLLEPYFFTGIMSNGNHTLTYALFFSIFFDLNSPLKSKKNTLVLRMAQFSILSTYFSAGLAKVQGILEFTGKSDLVWRSALNHIAYSFGEGSMRSPIVLELFKLDSVVKIVSLGFWGCVAFEVLCVLPVFNLKLLKAFGIFILIFHLLTGFLMGIFFGQAAFVAILFLTFAEAIFSHDNRETDFYPI